MLENLRRILRKRPQSRPIRWRFIVLGVVVLVLIAATGYLFNPAVQREYALRKLEPLVDAISIDYLSVTPWSAELRGVRVTHRGAIYQTGGLEFGFNPLALLSHTVSLRGLEMRGAAFDFTELEPTAPRATPFAGVLASLNTGYTLELGQLDARCEFRLRGGHTLDAVVTGGGFKALATGKFDLALRYAGPAEPHEAALRGRVELAQLNRGRVTKLVTEFSTQLPLRADGPPEAVSLKLVIEPPPAKKTAAGETAVPDEGVRAAPSERISARLTFGKTAHTALDIKGRYRGDSGRIDAEYRLHTDGGFLQGNALPDLISDSEGQIEIDTQQMTGALSLQSTTRVGELSRVLGQAPALPQYLALDLRAKAVFDQQQLSFNELELDIADDAGEQRAHALLTAPIALPFSNPLQVLQAPRDLADVVIGPLPLTWFEGRTPELKLNGELAGKYRLSIDDKVRVRLSSIEASTLSNMRVLRAVAPANGGAPGESVLLEGLTLSAQPSASWSPEFLRFAFNEIKIAAGEAAVATMNVKAAAKQGQAGLPTWRYRISTEAAYDALGAVPLVHAYLQDYALPAGLTLGLKGVVAQRGDAVTLEQVDVVLGQPAQPQILQVNTLRPFHLDVSGGAVQLKNRTGELAAIATHGFDLAWLNPLLKDFSIDGRASVNLSLSAPTEETLTISTVSPVEIESFGLWRAGKPLLSNLRVVLSPEINYAAEHLEMTAANFSARHAGREVLGGTAELALTGLKTPPLQISAGGGLSLDLTVGALQPVIAAALAEALPAIPLRAELDFALGIEGEAITAKKAKIDLAVGEKAHILVDAEPGLVIKTRLGAGENLARYFVGAAALDVKDLSSATLSEFLALKNISFAEINSSLRVKSDGTILRATTIAPLGVEAVRISDGSRELVREFSLRSEASLRLEGREVRWLFDNLVLNFVNKPSVPALAGHIRAHIEPGRRVPLTMLATELKADLPQLLNQPLLLPGHKLTGGSIALKVDVDASRKIAATVSLTDLTASEPLAIETFELPVTGEMAADGRGFDFTAPLIGRGKSGLTDAEVRAHFAPQPDEPRVLHLDIGSKLFYLNDILASVNAISARGVRGSGKRAKIKLSEEPDIKAAWKIIPYAVVIDLQIEKLFYSDYVAFTDVGGTLDLRRRKLALKNIKAHFHDSALKLNGVTRFKAGIPEPYDLDLTGKIADFDIDQFLTELVPGEKPRVEGLFGIDIKALGKFPNFSQLRNQVAFDVKMSSREGLFRPFPPNSGLLIGASDVLGVVGEVVSYVPTGGFGAGAVARLVNYISRIEYDTIDIHLVRKERRDVTVEQFLLLSPTIALSATGGIKREIGTDILDSPLELTAHLDMLGRGAAILYSMDLMKDEQNSFGYWRGPEFRIWGTPVEPQTNFDEVVQQASDGALKGAITRPISGLIGNLKYRWFNNDSRAREAAQRERLERREASEAAAAP